jgi:hypothetical protein
MPTVSVLMSVYNGEPYLSHAVQSILAQTYRDFELVIVDDGSTDRTRDILASFEASDGRIRILRNERNIGLSHSLNRGLSAVRARLVARMDADDLSRPDRLERQVAFLTERPEVDLVGSWLRVIGRNIILSRPSRHEDLVAVLCFQNCFWHPTLMFRLDRGDGTGIGEAIAYDAAHLYAEDYDLWVRLALDHRACLANIDEPLLHYRVHRRSVTQSHAAVQAETAQTIRRMQLQRLGLSPDAETLELHDLIATHRANGRPDLADRTAAWLARLKHANQRMGVYPQLAFSRYLEAIAKAVREGNDAAGEPGGAAMSQTSDTAKLNDITGAV